MRQPPPYAPSKPKRTVWKLIGGFLSIVFSICAFGGFILQFTGATAARDLPKELARAKSNGLWTEASDIPAVQRPGKDGLPILMKHEGQLLALAPDVVEWRKEFARADAKAAEALIAPYQAILKDSRELARAGHVNLRPDLSLGRDSETGMISAFRILLLLSTAEADLATKQGDHKAAIEGLKRAENLIRLIDPNDHLLAAMSQVSGRTALTTARIRGFQKWIANRSIREQFAREPRPFAKAEISTLIAAETYASLTSYRLDGAADPKTGIPRRNRQRTGMVRTLQIMNTLLELPEWKSKDWKTFVPKAEKMVEEGRYDLFGGGRMAYNTAPIFVFLPSVAFDQQVEILGTETMRWHLVKHETGKYPTQVAPSAKDVYSGELLRSISTPDGFVIYSVGVDFNDDGGRSREEVRGPGADALDDPLEQGDIVRTFPERL
ncbi:MAG: hypothetical protein LCH41_05060 [Armatimonadetes bacterium]|nr:hypothetical protein [Armatimonadota bacterium]